MPRTLQAPPPTTKTQPQSNPQTAAQPKTQPPWAVVLHNDDVNSFSFVIRSLRKVFNYGFLKAFKMSVETHVRGKCIVWSGMREVAEFKGEQLVACGPDPEMLFRGAQVLSVTIEPLPG